MQHVGNLYTSRRLFCVTHKLKPMQGLHHHLQGKRTTAPRDQHIDARLAVRAVPNHAGRDQDNVLHQESDIPCEDPLFLLFTFSVSKTISRKGDIKHTANVADLSYFNNIAI